MSRLSDLCAEYEAFIESERRELGLKPCTAPDDYHTACHVTNVNAAYTGSCARCHFGGTLDTSATTEEERTE